MSLYSFEVYSDMLKNFKKGVLTSQVASGKSMLWHSN